MSGGTVAVTLGRDVLFKICDHLDMDTLLHTSEDFSILDPPQCTNRIAQWARLLTKCDTIELMRSSELTALYPLTRTWTGLLRNFISADIACSAKWHQTRLSRELYGARYIDDDEWLSANILFMCGYDFDTHVQNWETDAPCHRWSCINQPCTFDDGGSLRLHFTNSDALPSTIGATCGECVWCIEGWPCCSDCVGDLGNEFVQLSDMQWDLDEYMWYY
ncbi:uncharacterized protein LAESUDRAFT_718465 [Laetiporus sulphureus 93-53]|uniref:Uncharacterized protein n=1 Tax=Laetiporus sulphureus 93-53 TaxID=1314785 RepID=A0A165AXT0_9APHY|nr:uncharacterized protein LAESUDRAFT_718465 [Laetiporus sulphureus 93-53]KZS99861.1 hypothetical protein LAESUDRAFT_718465 [Laetiporus sulphureus 93-53]